MILDGEAFPSQMAPANPDADAPISTTVLQINSAWMRSLLESGSVTKFTATATRKLIASKAERKRRGRAVLRLGLGASLRLESLRLRLRPPSCPPRRQRKDRRDRRQDRRHGRARHRP